MSIKCSSKIQDPWLLITLELYREYREIIAQKKLNLKLAQIELTEVTSYWGQWNPFNRTIQLSKKLITDHSWFVVVAILKHEMAHQYVDEILAFPSPPFSREIHGTNFIKACQKIGVPSFFRKSKIDLQSENLDWKFETIPDETAKLLAKVQKLLALAGSDNENEALLAMKKVRQLYAKYNLELTNQLSQKSLPEFYHLIIPMNGKNLNVFTRKISHILMNYFFVTTIYRKDFQASDQSYSLYLEIIGTKENVLMAEYVYYFLKNQLHEIALRIESKNTTVWNRITRKSFKLGLLEGFAEKLEKTHFSSDTHFPESLSTQKSLTPFHKTSGLNKYTKSIYPNLISTHSKSVSLDTSTYGIGKNEGKKITLHKPVETKKNSLGKLLPP